MGLLLKWLERHGLRLTLKLEVTYPMAGEVAQHFGIDADRFPKVAHSRPKHASMTSMYHATRVQWCMAETSSLKEATPTEVGSCQRTS